jgi:type II secretory pathway component PulM
MAPANKAVSWISSWTRERKIYLAVGVIACLAGILLIAFPL